MRIMEMNSFSASSECRREALVDSSKDEANKNTLSCEAYGVEKGKNKHLISCGSRQKQNSRLEQIGFKFNRRFAVDYQKVWLEKKTGETKQ